MDQSQEKMDNYQDIYLKINTCSYYYEAVFIKGAVTIVDNYLPADPMVTCVVPPKSSTHFPPLTEHNL